MVFLTIYFLCRETLKTMGILTLTSLYVFRQNTKRSSKNNCNTRIRYDVRVQLHRIILFSKRPSQARAQHFNIIPGGIKNLKII